MMSELERIASLLPAYEIGGEIGRGAWGVVLGATHRKLGREVAIKQLPRAFAADPLVQRRFETEAQLLGRLNHPHIVSVYDYVSDDGLCLLVMEMLHGGTVGSRFTTNVSMEAACSVALATAGAVGHAHEHGILHRDIKPENLLLTRTDTVKVSDFGIAKIVGGNSTTTVKGEVLGTPSYMPPEQAKAKELSPATDLYAVGTVLFELLSGRLPIDDEGDAWTVLVRHMTEEPIRLQNIAPDIPPGICDVVMTCLATDPKDRFQSAEDLGIAIADATTAVWGPGWNARTGLTIMASESVAAHLSSPQNSKHSIAEPAGETLPGALVAPSDSRRDDIRSRIVGLGNPDDRDSPQPPSPPSAGVPSGSARLVSSFKHRSHRRTYLSAGVIFAAATVVVMSLFRIGPSGGNASRARVTSTAVTAHGDTRPTFFVGTPPTSPTAALAAYVKVPIPNTHPTGITGGPGGALWFTEQATDSIWSLTPGGTPRMVKQLSSGSRPFRIIQGPDGNIWFTEGDPDSKEPIVLNNNGVGRLSPDGTQFKQISLPGSNPVAITIGPDQNIWVTGYNSDQVYRINQAGDRLGDYLVPNHPNSIVTGPDRNLWITEAVGAHIRVLSPDGALVHDFPVMRHPTAIIVGPDGKTEWVISHDSHSIQSITIDGVTSLELPAGSAPGDLAVGPDENLWYTDLDGHMVVVIAPDGRATIVKQIPVTGGGMPFAVTTNGPKGSVWFTVVNEQGPSNVDAINQVTG